MKTKLPNNPVIDWLLEDDEPSIRYRALTELLGYSLNSSLAVKTRAKIAKSARVMALFSGQTADGGFNCKTYDKWMGAHWRLPCMVDLALPHGDKRAIKAMNTVFDWLTGEKHKKHIRLINGLTRRCAAQEGNALLSACRLGIATDPRCEYLADSIISWQWPDGGWNCDKDKTAHHSSFYETVIPLQGLIAYHQATGHRKSQIVTIKAGEFLLRHRLFKSESDGKVIDPNWLKLYYPSYWHYNILQGLTTVMSLGKLNEPRATEALDFLEQKRLPDGRWKADSYHWKPTTTKGRYRSPVDWWRGEPNKMLTLQALIVLKAVKRWKP
jgi:hypothetical protein